MRLFLRIVFWAGVVPALLGLIAVLAFTGVSAWSGLCSLGDCIGQDRRLALAYLAGAGVAFATLVWSAGRMLRQPMRPRAYAAVTATATLVGVVFAAVPN